MQIVALICRILVIGILGGILSACSAGMGNETVSGSTPPNSVRSATIMTRPEALNATPTAPPMTPGLLYFVFNGEYPDYVRLQSPGFADNYFGNIYTAAVATDNRLRLYTAYGGDGETPNGVLVFNKEHKQVQSFTFSDDPGSMALDASHQVFLAVFDPTNHTYDVDVFASGASGPATPLHRLGGANTQIGYPRAIAVDASGTLYVANTSISGTSPPYDILVFANDARGNTPPIRVINGDQTGLTEPVSLALGADGNLYVANKTSNGYDVLVFPMSGNGNIAPIRTLESTPFGSSIVLGTNGEMILGGGDENAGHSCFAIYAPGASGNDPPESYPEENFENRVGDYCNSSNYIFSMALEHPWYQP